MKVSEARALSTEEIQEKVKSLKQDLMQKRFQAKTGKLENRSEIKKIRRDIARLLTVVSETKPKAEAKP